MMQDTIAALEARLADAETPGEKVTAMNALAWQMRLVDPHRAYAVCVEAAGLVRESGELAVLAVSLGIVAACAIILGYFEDAAAALDEGLPLSRLSGDLSAEAHCLHSLGVLHYNHSQHEDAIKKTMEALQIREELEDWEGVGASLNTLGNIQFVLCDYGAALDWYTCSLTARERAGDLPGIGSALNNIGNVYGEQGNWAEAAQYHERGLDHAVRIGASVLEIKLLCNLSANYTDLGRHKESIEIGRRIITQATAMKNWVFVAYALTNLASSFSKTGRQAEAIDYYTRAIELGQTIGDRKIEAHARYCVGGLLADDGQLDDARRFLADGFASASAIGTRRTAFLAARKLSEVCKRQGDYAAALGHFEDFQRLEKEVFTEEADMRTKSLIIKMEVEHHRRETEALSEINAALQEANARLEALATTDPLTGLPNHRTLVAALDAETARVRRNGRPCSLLFLDVDHFKKFNDTHGHSIGDAVLSEFAACVSACLREEDTLGRWGGEEFLALLPGVGLAEALEVGERVRAAVADHPLQASGGLRMTCSIGAAACPAQEASRQALVDAADTALYAAKRLGRNQVRGAGDPAILALDGPPLPGLRGPQHPALPPQTSYQIGANDQRHRED